MHVLTWRDQGDRQLHGARQAYRRRASACARDLAHVPAHLHARTGPDRFLHPQRDLRSIQAHPRNRHERASNRPQVHRAIRLFSLPRAIARESSNLPQMRLGPLLAQFVAHSGGPGAVSWRRAPRGLLPRRSGSPCHGALADVRLAARQKQHSGERHRSLLVRNELGHLRAEPDRPPTDACSRSIARARSRIMKTSASSGSKVRRCPESAFEPRPSRARRRVRTGRLHLGRMHASDRPAAAHAFRVGCERPRPHS